jgi:alkylated DNA nucleotide flippase Atl1
MAVMFAIDFGSRLRQMKSATFWVRVIQAHRNAAVMTRDPTQTDQQQRALLRPSRQLH